MSKNESIESFPNPGRTIEGLRDTGYNFETAVADLVDNSIAAESTKIDIQVDLDFRGKVRLSIADDGFGMNKLDLINAMQYGSPKRKDPASLGKYGLGLKTASTAFCRRLSLISRPSGGSIPMMATWDLDHVVEQEKWLLQMSDNPDKEALEHLNQVSAGSAGTVVLWTKVDRLLRDYQNPTGIHARNAVKKRRKKLHDHIAMTYQRFLDKSDNRARNVEISLDGAPINAWDPFQKGLSELVVCDTRETSFNGTESSFKVQAYILPRREEFPSTEQAKLARLSSKMQGFYIYRENRLIHGASWLGMFQKEPHGTLLRIEFSFDHKLDDAFQLDIKKSQIFLKEELWNWLKDQFLPAPRREADRRYRTGQNRKISRKTKGAHTASNKTIGSKEDEVGGPDIKISDPTTGDVIISNQHGEFETKLKISPAASPGEVFVQPADDVEDGCLFEPALIEKHKAVRINTKHPYYHKVYVPNLNNSVTVQGMDSLLWALCLAELSSTTDKTAEAFQDMRFEITRILRKLVETLPDPKVDEDEDFT